MSDLNFSVMSQWCYNFSVMSQWTSKYLSYLSGATMLGSSDLNISVMSDWESQWCHHAKFLGTQYICHGGLGVPVVLLC
jgi:hypothetical protein